MRHAAFVARTSSSTRRSNRPYAPGHHRGAVGIAAAVPAGSPARAEAMEPRRLLAADGGTIDFDPEARVVTVTGTDGADVIRVDRVGIDDVNVTVNSVTRRLDMDDVNEYSLRGLGGNDDISALGELMALVTVFGGDGVDTISTHFAFLRQGEIFRDGVRTIAAEQPDGSLLVDGTPGDDVIELTQDTEGKNVRVNSDYVAMFLLEEFNGYTVRGDGGNDQLSVGDVFDAHVTLIGDGGAGEVGNDVFSVAQISRVSVVGGPGDDLVKVKGNSEEPFVNLLGLQGGTGSDTIDLDEQGGVDLRNYPDVENVTNAHGDVFGNALNNVIVAAPGDTRPLTARGGDGDDFIAGGAGNDNLFGEGDDDRIFGNEGDDLLDGGPGDDFLDGGPGDDTLVNGEDGPGTPAVQVFIDDDGTLLAIGSEFNDVIRVSRVGADDVVVEANGISRRFDMDDFDRIRLEGRDGNDSIQLTTGVAGATLLGGNGEDALVGNELPNTFRGGAGNDRIDALQGADRAFGEDGDDTLNGGAGSDLLDGGDGDDTFIGGTGADTMYGDPGDDTFFARDGVKDTLVGGAGAADRSQHDAVDSRSGIEQTIA